LQSFSFVPSESGSYTFFYTGAFGNALSIFADRFDPRDACSKFLNSTFDSSAFNISETVTVTLEANRRYMAVVQSFSDDLPDPSEYPVTYSVGVADAPEGASFTDDVPPPADYAYTYLAVDDASQIVRAADAASDFRGLTEGNYLVYGIRYPGSIATSDWLGQPLSAIVSDDAVGCRVLSANQRRLVVVPSEAGALPLRWLAVSAEPTDTEVEVRWSVDQQVNVEAFFVERSADGVNWTDLTTLDGAGDQFLETHYLYPDRDPLPDQSYYRIRQTDFDGSQTRSRIVSVQRSSTTHHPSLSVFPNPVQYELTVESEELLSLPIRLYDVGGRQYALPITVGGDGKRASVEMGSLPPGMYLLAVGSDRVRVIKPD
jgi:hypothetical protein